MDPDWRCTVFPMYFLIKNGDIPASYVSLPEGILDGSCYIVAKPIQGLVHFNRTMTMGWRDLHASICIEELCVERRYLLNHIAFFNIYAKSPGMPIIQIVFEGIRAISSMLGAGCGWCWSSSALVGFSGCVWQTGFCPWTCRRNGCTGYIYVCYIVIFLLIHKYRCTHVFRRQLSYNVRQPLQPVFKNTITDELKHPSWMAIVLKTTNTLKKLKHVSFLCWKRWNQLPAMKPTMGCGKASFSSHSCLKCNSQGIVETCHLFIFIHFIHSCRSVIFF